MSAPDLIGRYRLGPRLGSGGFAVVWLAHDGSLDTEIAIKIMAENWADRMDLRERFLTEARMLRRASSNRVVQVFDIGELPDGRPYFVMEFADRGTLEDLARPGPLPVAEALWLTAEVARGVAELHRAGIVHRDIKPSNVLRRSTPDGGERLLVADLGVAKNLAQASGLTMSVGSAGYSAPEQAEANLGVDVRADVYSLGAVGYRLITGSVPAMAGKVLPLRQLRPDAPVEVERALARAMAPDREKRWPGADSLANELERLADHLESSPRARSRRPGPKNVMDAESAPPARNAPPRGRFRRRRVMAGLIVLTVLVVAAGAGGLWRWHDVARPVTVLDDTRHIRLTVPPAWAGQARPHGWDPASIGLAKGAEPGLLVSDDMAEWGDLGADVDGVFVGLTSDPRLPAAYAAIGHADCHAAPAGTYGSTRWKGRIRRWTACDGGTRSLEEILLTPVGGGDDVYVQIRQAGGPDRTTEVLDGLSVV